MVELRHTAGVKPRVGVATIRLDSPDETFAIGREAFPQFELFERLGVHVQSDRVRPAEPGRDYVEAALAALAEACDQLDVPEASIAFYPGIVWVFANWTALAELRGTVRHEAAPLAFARTHTAAESAGHSGPSEDFALAFEEGTGS